MLNVNIRYRGKKYLPLTTDDINELNSYKNNDNVLKLIHENKKQWNLLEDINSLICNETTNFILQNKPVFDKEKLKLIKIDLLINKILDFGLKYSFENNNNDITLLYNKNTNDDYNLDVNTFNNSWNTNSEKINMLIKNIINEYKKEHTIINVINDSIVNNTNVVENRKWIRYLIIFIMLLSPIIYYYYYYYY